MFKLESYVTPVILSYVEKYVKNFKPDKQYQVSLWGGLASFQNLDLRLEVLEEQLNLPFTFVSGHIHELLIHVPWAKITSEPVVVTINTIECVLKLKEENQSDNVSATTPAKQIEIPQEGGAPHGYIKSIITRVINNMTIHCNNLILKYVEEDIVLSINVRLLSMNTVNDKWEPAFIDVNSHDMKLQKTITIRDLTLCLDKMDTSGKIEIYQDPVLYRCSMLIRLFTSYNSDTAKRSAITRFDLHCKKMEFSITEQQIPMILRLVSLFTLLQSRKFSSTKEKPRATGEESQNISNVDEVAQVATSTEDTSWGMWLWSAAATILPLDWDGLSDENNLAISSHIMHFGIYVDDATITFKTVESVKEQLFYKSRKIKYKSFLTLRLTDVIFDSTAQGIEMTNFIAGFGSLNLYPRGSCSCGFVEVADGVQPPLYLVAGEKKTDLQRYLKDTLFDSNAVENQGHERTYEKDVTKYLSSTPVSVLLERCSAFCMNYVHFTEIPDDITSESISEFGSSYEYSNFREERYVRYCIGNLTLRLCSGLFHRIETIKDAVNKYDYTPYVVPKPAPTYEELPPVTVEEYDALRENIPEVQISVHIKKSAVQIQLADHRVTGLPRQKVYIENRTEPVTPTLSEDPYLHIECDEGLITMKQPLYQFRLIACASKQSEIPPEMLSHCYRDIKAQLQGISSQVYLKSNCHTSIVMPCSIEYNLRTLLYPSYWQNLNIIHKSHNFKMDSITITGTKRKFTVAYAIALSLLYPDDASNPLICSSLFADSCDEKNPIYIELCLENIVHNGEMTATTVSSITNISAIKIFAHNETQQSFILSGPETENQEISSEMLVTAIVQFSTNSNLNENKPPILLFRIAPMNGCIDPLLLQWLDYRVTYYRLERAHSVKSEVTTTQAESVISESGGKKRTFPSLHESVHSSSDKERKKMETTEKLDRKSVHVTNESDKIFLGSDSSQEKMNMLSKFNEFYPWWSKLIIYGSVDHIILYLPTKTISCIGAEGIEHAKTLALQNDENLQILAIKFPMINIHSSNMQPNFSLARFNKLPIKLPNEIYTSQAHSCPWKIEILNFEAFTLKGESQKNFIKKICFTSTLDLTIKHSNSDSMKTKPSTVSLCLYIDTSPVIISASEDQVMFLYNIFTNIMNSMQTAKPRKEIESSVNIKEVKDISFAVPRSSSSPTQLFYPEDATTTSTISAIKENPERDDEDVHLTASIQWTITKVAFKLYVLGEHEYATLKLVFELEDIITSVDMQSVYLKLKHKITSATIFHYARDSPSQPWNFGEYVGLLLCGREDNYEKNEDSGFLSITLTVAKSGNVHTRWSGRKTHKMPRRDFRTEVLQPCNHYITEALVKIQMLDIIIPPSVCAKYVQLVKPFLSQKSSQTQHQAPYGKNIQPPFIGIANLRNESLPLVYLEFQGLRLMIPDSSKSIRESHDLLMLQLDGIRINPHAENPICRIPLRPDIYQLAAQANLLNVPGSAVEDRQYQINIDGICMHTTTWKDYQQSVVKRMSQSYLYTMNENPAVEWNKLGNGSSLEPHFSTHSVITRFDFCFIVAPAIIFKPDTMVCASAVEINCLTDLELTVNLDQIKLMTSLNSQFQNLVPSQRHVDSKIIEAQNFSKQTPSSIKSVHLAKQSIVESETDFAKDSGVDFDISSITSTNPEKNIVQERSGNQPFEFLVNCGKVTVIIYELKTTPDSNKQSDNTKEVKEEDVGSLKLPLVYAMINQPNVYFSQQYYDQKIQVSCFDVALLLGDESDENLTQLPTESNFKICLIETKCGEPHPDTGIPPSFLVIKYELFAGKNSILNINLGRPTKVHFSLSRLSSANLVKAKILESFGNVDSVHSDDKLDNEETNCGSIACPANESTTPRTRKYNLPDVNLTSRQLVLSFKRDSEEPSMECLLSLASISGSLSSGARPERLYGSLNWDSLLLSTQLGSRTMLLLNPCCGSGTLGLGWENWQSNDLSCAPHLQLQADIDCLYVDFGPRHVIVLEGLIDDYRRITEMLSPTSQNDDATPGCRQEPTAAAAAYEQHYKDDLKSGAFQFVDGNVDELPFPYQVVFFPSPQAMAWRYPHPRALTKIHVNPVPFESQDESEGYSDSEDRIACAIEYWSESKMAYQRYVELYLSETESYRLDLPDRPPLQAVACIWRIVLLDEQASLSSKALLACLRIDSYFNPRIVPVLQAAFSIKSFQLRLHNHLDESETMHDNLPAPLSDYRLSGMIPESQCFALLEHKNASLVVNKWPDGSHMFHLAGNVGVHLLDYGLLVLQQVLDSFDFKLQASIGADFSLDLSILTCQPFSLKLSPSVFHTLALSTHLWNNLLLSRTESTENALVLTTRYAIANDTNVPIRFGQSATDDNILLESRQCYFYSWRHANKQVLRIAVEETGWSWSKAFPINVNGTYEADFSNSSHDIVISINVTSLSASQKLVTFTGQFTISNQLSDHLEMKLVKYDAAMNNKPTVSRDVFQILGKSKPPSIVFADNKNMAMRLRFACMECSSWTGDIPLQPNARWGQPWLVKVPLEEKGQFVSVWVRIIIEHVNGKHKILAIISPLYMIRSYLPVPAKVRIETPSLQASMITTINGQGERQQLYCPGTFEHFHQLSFQIEPGNSASDPFVPLSYSSVDQRKFFKRPEKECINDVLAALELTKEESKWPFQSDGLPWIAGKQPQTHVQIKYEDAGLASTTLLLELQPWCFILNSFGIPITIISEDVEICKIPHYGTVAPPKLEHIFHFGVTINDTRYLSSALQLVKSEWSQSFYMPRIEGLIPLEGNFKTRINCDSSICTLSITSNIQKDMRIIRINSNYVIGNTTSYELNVATFAVSSASTNLNLIDNLNSPSIKVSPSTDQRHAVPLTQWHVLTDKRSDSFAFYIVLQLNNKSWSCPVRVDLNLSRRCIALPNGKTTIPLVITTQEDKSTIYIAVHIDKHPQLYIENMCPFNIIIGQANEESENILPDAQHFEWKCQVFSRSSCHYSMPTVGSQLPDLIQSNNNNESHSMLISALPIKEDLSSRTSSDSGNLEWSKNIRLTDSKSEQYVRLPHYGDVKLFMQTQCYTTFVRFTPISQVEISAQEIRNKIQKKDVSDEDRIESNQDSLFSYIEDEKSPLIQQSNSSSTSTATFLSAQDEISDLSVSPTHILHYKSSNESQANRTSTPSDEISTVETSKKKTLQNSSIIVHLTDFSIVIMRDVNGKKGERVEVANLSVTDAVCIMDCRDIHSNLSVYIGDLQLDNQMFEQGGFDFSVVFIGQKPYVKKDSAICLTNNLRNNVKNIIENSLFGIDLVWENSQDIKACKEVSVKIAPISAYIEGAFISLLMDYSKLILPPCFIPSSSTANAIQPLADNYIIIPDYILLDSKILSQPLRIESLVIEPLSVLLSVHTSVHVYVAFDHSPLVFDAFDRKNLVTTPYRLGNALAMHYLSGAIFGVGWVVGSLEILGSPGGLAQALGTGLKDFISMPFQGLLQGPWGFIVGVTHGSASLVKHITAGTVNSVTKLASSVARNLDRLTLDEEHLQRQELYRRRRPRGVAQGLYQGLTGFGMSLLAAIAGLAHQPLQQVIAGEASSRGLVTGVGRGLVGAVTKPLSGAAELIALTGQGLLQGTGWISLPSPRHRPAIQYSNESGVTSLRYAWRLMPMLAKSDDSILHVSNADHVVLHGSNSKAVSLVITKQTLMIVNIAEDSVEKIFSLKDLTAVDSTSESNVFRLYCSTVVPTQLKKVSPVEQVAAHMDREMRARVAEFLRTSSTGITSVSTNSDAESETDDPVTLPEPENSLTFYVGSDSRSYLLSIFNMAKSQSQGNGFAVI